MKKYLVLSLLIIGFLTIGNTHGKEEVYYCAEIDKNGFSYDSKNGKYERSGFLAEKFKMKLDTASNLIHLAFDDDDNNKTLTCNMPLLGDVLTCTEWLGFYGFNFNTENGRFVYSKGFGYVDGDHDSIDISYGKCDKF